MSGLRGRWQSRRLLRALTLGWAALTAALLLVPGAELPGSELEERLGTALELAAHCALFFGLSWLAVRGVSPRRGTANELDLWTARRRRLLALVLAYCVLLEILQIAVPGRGFELVDIAAGWVGAFLGLGKRS